MMTTRGKKQASDTTREQLLSAMDGACCQHAWQDGDAGDLMRILCEEVGPRPAGGEGMRQARALLAERLSAIGAVNVHEEPVAVRTWRPGTTELELRAPTCQPITCGQYLFSASIDAEVPLLSLVGSSLEELHRRAADMQGNAVLIDGHAVSGVRYISMRQRIALLCQAGAAAVITRSSAPTGLPALDIADMCGVAPAACVSVSREDGDALAAAAASDCARVYLHADGHSGIGECANLLADLGPDHLPTMQLVLGAHLDSYWNAPGACDNLTGVVTLLEVARLLAPFRCHFTRRLRLIAYTGEEIGCLGSRAYVAGHGDEIAHTVLAVNMDMLFSATARGTAVMWSPEMRDYIDVAFRHAGREVEVRNLFCSASDYFPFMLAGIPAIRPADYEQALPIWWHSAADDLAHARVDWVQQNAMVYAQLLARLLTDPSPLPARRLSHGEVTARLEDEGLGEWMRAQGYTEAEWRMTDQF